MAQEEIVKMSEKGQLVVPRRIREKEGFKSSDRFIAVEVEDGVFFKRVEIPEIKIEFEALSRDIQAHFKNNRVKPADVVEAVKWTRQRQK